MSNRPTPSFFSSFGAGNEECARQVRRPCGLANKAKQSISRSFCSLAPGVLLLLFCCFVPGRSVVRKGNAVPTRRERNLMRILPPGSFCSYRVLRYSALIDMQCIHINTVYILKYIPFSKNKLIKRMKNKTVLLRTCMEWKSLNVKQKTTGKIR